MERPLPGARLLGRPRVVVAGGEFVLGAERPAQLLAHLAYVCDWVERERLAGLFWSDVDEATARQNLRQLVGRVRALELTPPPELERRRLRWRVDSDVAQLRAALAAGDEVAATTRYTGLLLEGVEGYRDGGFRDWLEGERAALHARVRSAALRLAANSGARPEGRATAGRALERLLVLDPLDEEVLAARLASLHADGHVEAALAEYRAFETRLRRELGLKPAAELREIAARLLDGARAPSRLNPAPPTVVRSGPEPSSASRLPQLGTFVGRDVELALVVERVTGGARLVTLVGHSGVGKTRLAIEAARELGAGRAAGVVFVPLADVAAVDRVPDAMAAALGVRSDPTRDPFEGVAAALERSDALVVLDNLEHLDAAATVAGLLAAAPRIVVLATSHRRLALAEEWVVPLDGLAVPAADADADSLAHQESVRLFVERARRADPNFGPVGGDLVQVAEICRLTGGSPLAIEIAAGWVRSMPLADLVAEIGDAVDALASDASDVPARHRSVRAALDHSWSAIPEARRRTLARLAVFRGGFDRAAAKAVAGAHAAELAAFRDASLVRLDAGRHDLHPLVRTYLSEALAAFPGEPHATRDRHAHHVLALLERPEGRQLGRAQTMWLQDVARDHGNVRSAIEHAVDVGATDLALRLVGPLQRFWLSGGGVAEGRRWCEAALNLPNSDRPSVALARALNTYGALLMAHADIRGAERAFERSAAVGRAVGSEEAVARTAIGAGLAAARRGATEVARARYVEGLEAQRRLGAVEAVAGLLNNLGVLALEEAQGAEAVRWLSDGLATARAMGDDVLAITFHANLGWAERLCGDLAGARRTLGQALAAASELGLVETVSNTLGNLAYVELELGRTSEADRLSQECLSRRLEADDTWGLAYTLDLRSSVAAALGDDERCAVLTGAAAALRERIGTPRPAGWAEPAATFAARARRALGEARFEAAVARGRSLGAHEVVAVARGGGGLGATSDVRPG